MRPIYKIDRSTLNLPAEQTCSACNKTLPNADFKLKHRNRADAPYELHLVCKECNKAGNKLAKISLVNAIKNGERVVSDRLITLLQKNNGKDLDRVLKTLITSAITSGDPTLLALLIKTAQGQAPMTHIKDNKTVDDMPIKAPDNPMNLGSASGMDLGTSALLAQVKKK